MIEIKNITKKYPTVTALDDVTLTIEKGEFFGLLGPNGAGKTTLMSLMVGYQQSDAGSVTIDGETVSPQNMAVRHKIGLVPQSIALYDELSAQQNLEIFGSMYRLPRQKLQDVIKGKLESVQLYHRRKDKVGTFSGGMKRRLNIIASLLHQPTLLLCDEPTVGVDPQSRNAIFDFLLQLNEQGITIVYTTHYMEEAERMCRRLAIIDHGHIIAMGTTEELLARLPFQETIRLTKSVTSCLDPAKFAEFGQLKENDDAYNLLLKPEVKLSEFIVFMERHHISYNQFDLERPTLEALFLHLTGRSLRE